MKYTEITKITDFVKLVYISSKSSGNIMNPPYIGFSTTLLSGIATPVKSPYIYQIIFYIAVYLAIK